MHIAVSERMEEVQRKTSEKTQARHSQSWPGQYPVVCCMRAPGMTSRDTNMSVTARDSSNRLGGWRRARLHNTEINTYNIIHQYRGAMVKQTCPYQKVSQH